MESEVPKRATGSSLEYSRVQRRRGQRTMRSRATEPLVDLDGKEGGHRPQGGGGAGRGRGAGRRSGGQPEDRRNRRAPA